MAFYEKIRELLAPGPARPGLPIWAQYDEDRRRPRIKIDMQTAIAAVLASYKNAGICDLPGTDVDVYWSEVCRRTVKQILTSIVEGSEYETWERYFDKASELIPDRLGMDRNGVLDSGKVIREAKRARSDWRREYNKLMAKTAF